MALKERLIYAIDIVTDGASKGLSNFRTAVAQAEGATGKLKAGWQSAGATISQNAGLIAVSAGTAIAAFGVKAVNAFQDTAIAAGKFSEATGLAVEEASRWAEVAGDVGVSVDTIQGAFVRLNKAIDAGKLEEFGVQAQRAADGTVDVNETMLESIRVIGAIEDPTKRAAAAQAAFGRSYAAAAEIIFDSAENVEQKLADVSDSKVIDDEELAKAERFREMTDELKDSLEDLELVAGEALVPLLSDMAEIVLTAKDAKNSLEDMLPGDVDVGIPDVVKWLDPNRLNPVKIAYDNLKDPVVGLFTDGKEAAEEFAEGVEQAGDAAATAGDEFEGTAVSVSGFVGELADAAGVVGDVAGELNDLRSRLSEAQQAAARFADAVVEAWEQKVAAAADELQRRVDNALGRVTDAFDEVDKNLRQQDLLADIAQGWADIEEAEKEAIEGGEEGRRAYEQEIRDQQRAVLDLLRSVDNFPANRAIQLSARINQADLTELQNIVFELSQGVTVPVSFAPQAAFGGVNGVFDPNAGIANPTFTAPQQPQVAVPGGTFNITNNYPVGTTPTSVNQDIGIYAARNGVRYG